MSRPLLVLRPPPGNAASVARVERHGLRAIALPLFETVALAWSPPDPAKFDALLLTSANAVRHLGAELDRLRALPVVAVGAATAAAARDAGLTVAIVGDGDAAAAVAQARVAGHTRLLRLAGRERVALDGVVDAIVYASNERALLPGSLAIADGAVALLHSPRAARVFADLIDRGGVPRDRVIIAALSDQVAAAAGAGWADVLVAPQPTDAALIAAAATRAIDP